MSTNRSRLIVGVAAMAALAGVLFMALHVSRKQLARYAPTAAEAARLDRLMNGLTPDWTTRYTRIVDRALRPCALDAQFLAQVNGTAPIQGNTPTVIFARFRARWFKWRWNREPQLWPKRESAKRLLISMGTNAWPAVPALLDLAARDDPTTRFDAMEVLSGIRADQHPAFRVMIADHLKVARCAEDLARTLKSAPSDFWVSTERAKQQFALALLSAAGPAARQAVPSLVVLAESKNDHDLRAAGVAVLRDIGPSARSAVPVLKKLLQDKDEWPDVRSRAATALPRICPKDPEIVRLLSQMLYDDRILVRVRVAGALADLKAPPNDLLPVLTNALDHKLASIRLAALESLCEMDDAALPVKEQVASRLQDNDDSVRRAALATLQTLARSSTR